MLDLYQIFSDHGPWIGVTAILGCGLGAYIRRDWKRLDLLEKRVAKLEEEVRTSYGTIIGDNTQALNSTNKLLEKFLLKD